MRQVFDNDMVAHVWAQQSQPHGKSSNGQYYFENATIYSYGAHFPIATFHNVKGSRFVLFTQRSYSMTTGRHISRARGAVRGTPVYFVPGDPRDLSRIKEQYQRSIDDAVAAAVRETKEARRNFAKRALDHLTTANSVAEQGNELLALIGVRGKLKAPAVDPAEVEKAAKAKARKDAAAAVAAAKREEERAKEYADKRSAWLAGADIYAGRWSAPCGGAALRIVGDELQTSHGASVPMAHAVRVFKFLKLCREQTNPIVYEWRPKQVVWAHNGHSVRVGHFTVDEVYADGSFKAGCHEIEWQEVERVARAHGIWDTPADDSALSLTHAAA